MSADFPHLPCGTRHLARRHRLRAAMVAGLLLATQVLAAVHLIAVPHTIDARSGKATRCRHSRELTAKRNAPSHSDGARSDSIVPGGETASAHVCPVYALLRQAQLLTSPVAPVQPLTAIPDVAAPSLDVAIPDQRRIYLVSPSQSPPVRTLV